MVIEGIHVLLQNEPDFEWMGHATNAASCQAFLLQHKPDVIFMDIGLPDKSGIDLCKEVKHTYPGIHILGLSTYNQQGFIEKMMDHGASGYILKNATRKELVEAVNTVMKGKTYMSFEVVQSLRGSDQHNTPMITRREKEVLELIAEGCTNNMIAEKLFISINTVDTHRKNLLAKFNVPNTASLIKTAAQQHII
jgi:DNA-binding NarL/FixJ family response regulator